jgi:hypothetical protein
MASALFFFSSFFLNLSPSRADSLEDAIRALARKVAPVVQRDRPVSLVWQNRSSVSDARSDLLRKLFAEELDRDNIAISQEPSAPVVRVSIGDTPTRVQFVAEVPSASGEMVLMNNLPRSALSAEEKSTSVPRLQKELIWQQPEAILDAIEHVSKEGKQSFFLLLTRDSLLLYRGEKGQWALRDSKPIPLTDVPTRDPRAEIWFSPEHEDQVRVVLPKKACEAKLTDKILLNCRVEAEHWREGMFLMSPCNQALWWLRAEMGDRSTPDRLHLRNPSLPKTEPSISVLELPGPVISISSGQALQADSVVVFNLSTGNYEVYRISLACAN